ncbi:MAG: methylated-DNA--[protein]-cysteine S-methyltransferase [Acidobacteriota bacterium]
MKIATPFGPAWAAINKAGAVTAFGFGETTRHADPDSSGSSPELARQLDEFFAGTRAQFDVPLAAKGSDFQKRVWEELRRIPVGQSISYAELAKRVGRPGAARAVGRANATNPIALLVPCHRVIGSGGKLTGYAYGVELKEKLLNWEKSENRFEQAAKLRNLGA